MIGKKDDGPIALDQEEDKNLDDGLYRQNDQIDPGMFASVVDSEMQLAMDISKIDELERKSK